MSRADILVTHAFWAPLILPRKTFGKQYVHVGRYPKRQLRFYKKASRLQVPSNAIKDICLEQAPSLSSKIKTLPYPLTWPIPPKEVFEEKDKTVLYAGRIHGERSFILVRNMEPVAQRNCRWVESSISRSMARR